LRFFPLLRVLAVLDVDRASGAARSMARSRKETPPASGRASISLFFNHLPFPSAARLNSAARYSGDLYRGGFTKIAPVRNRGAAIGFGIQPALLLRQLAV
jgi:hypothetical protein